MLRMNARNIVWSGSMALRTVEPIARAGTQLCGLKRKRLKKSLLFAAQWEDYYEKECQKGEEEHQEDRTTFVRS